MFRKSIQLGNKMEYSFLFLDLYLYSLTIYILQNLDFDTFNHFSRTELVPNEYLIYFLSLTSLESIRLPVSWP